MSAHTPSRNLGFTLVEMSIVLAILGLLVGGIVAGQSIIRAGQVNKVLADLKTYATAIQQFKDKYGALPGDFQDATRVWGRMNLNADCVTNSSMPVATSGGACDGNGDGIIKFSSTINQASEDFQTWRQLNLAGMIAGTFTGLNGPVNIYYDVIPGVNSPVTAIDNTTFWMFSWGFNPSTPTVFYAGDGIGDYTNSFVYGARVTNDWNHGGALTGKEAYQLDLKVDDGLPAFGSVRTLANSWYQGVNGVTNTCTSSDTPSSAVYLKSVANPTCFLVFPRLYAPKTQ